MIISISLIRCRPRASPSSHVICLCIGARVCTWKVDHCHVCCFLSTPPAAIASRATIKQRIYSNSVSFHTLRVPCVWVRLAKTLTMQTFKMVNFKSTTKMKKRSCDECSEPRVIVSLCTHSLDAMRVLCIHGTVEASNVTVSCEWLFSVFCFEFLQNAFCYNLISHQTSHKVHSFMLTYSSFGIRIHFWFRRRRIWMWLWKMAQIHWHRPFERGELRWQTMAFHSFMPSCATCELSYSTDEKLKSLLLQLCQVLKSHVSAGDGGGCGGWEIVTWDDENPFERCSVRRRFNANDVRFNVKSENVWCCYRRRKWKLIEFWLFSGVTSSRQQALHVDETIWIYYYSTFYLRQCTP